MMLEIGPGSNKYKFKPKLLNGEVIYVDLHKPSSRFRNMWVIADGLNLPFKQEAFEEVVASHVLEHLLDPLCFLSECRRVLKNNGSLRLFTPNFLSRNAKTDPEHVHVFNFMSLWNLMRSAGFKPFYPSRNIGSLLPKNLIRLIKIFLLTISEELEINGIKNSGNPHDRYSTTNL